MKLQYKGNGLLAPKTIKRGDAEETLFPYIADPELIKSVNLAILLQRPLLLMGEPGGGKSRLAQAVAYELYHRENAADHSIIQDYADFYQEWNIKSSSNATEGLYEYDAIQRLGDAQVKKENLDKGQYIKMREMGLAFESSVSEDKRVVLLIDEIDKADIDFPNDLLNELDKGQFTIADTGKTIRAKVKPIVFITSNAEKELPDAFLRRCLFHQIQPLSKEILSEIIERRFYADQASHTELITKALDQFLTIRQEIKQAALAAGKNVSTSELLDWFQAIKYYSDLKMSLNELNQTDNAHLKSLITELEKLGKGKTDIPFKQILFKNWSTFVNFEQK